MPFVVTRASVPISAEQETALEGDLRYKESLGIWALPAFLVEHGEQRVLIRGVASYEALTQAIASVAAPASRSTRRRSQHAASL